METKFSIQCRQLYGLCSSMCGHTLWHPCTLKSTPWSPVFCVRSDAPFRTETGSPFALRAKNLTLELIIRTSWAGTLADSPFFAQTCLLSQWSCLGTAALTREAGNESNNYHTLCCTKLAKRTIMGRSSNSYTITGEMQEMDQKSSLWCRN